MIAYSEPYGRLVTGDALDVMAGMKAGQYQQVG